MGSSAIARLDRLESLESIRQLAHRYAHFVDSRNFEGVGELYVEAVEVHRSAADGSMHVEVGRAAIKRWFDEVSRSARAKSCHFVGTHVIDLESPTTASGVVYCLGTAASDEPRTWKVTLLKYEDRYVRAEERWLFQSRFASPWLGAEFPVSGDNLLGALQAAFPRRH